MAEATGYSPHEHEMDRLRADAMTFAGIGLFRYRFDGTVIFMDAGAVRIFELEDRFPDPAAVAGHKMSELLVYMQPEGTVREAIRSNGHQREYEYTFKTLTGRQKWVLHDAYLVRDPQSGEEAIQVVVQDITVRKQTEDALRRERDRIQQYLDIAGVILVVLDPRGTVTLINRKGCETLGRAEAKIVGRSWFDEFIPERMREEMKTVFTRLIAGELELTEYFENPIVAGDGKERSIAWHNTLLRDDTGRIKATLSSGEDITDRLHAEGEQQRLQEQLRQAQKMEALGRLAGGVAHDFNNLLTAIIGAAEVGREIVLNSPEKECAKVVRNCFDEIEEAGQRAALLTRQLLTFSRKHVARMEVVDPNRIVAGMEKLLRRLIGEHISLRASLAPGVHHARVDAGRMDQVIMNLVLNARDAMPDGGRLVITTSNVALSKAYVARHMDARTGPHVLIKVSDTGLGMDAETQRRLFEPFFTTKPPGQGTGLGLATVYGIVSQAGGHITVKSKPGAGSVFQVYLPAMEQRSTPIDGEKVLPRGGQETVLLCEDDDLVRSLACRILKGAGYQVLDAGTGEEGLALAGAHREPLHLLITDMVMPGLNGRQVAERLVALHPETRVLFISGYASDIIAQQGLLDNSNRFLEKPFNPSYFLQQVREVLDEVRP